MKPHLHKDAGAGLLDLTGISLALTCMAHCLLLPVALTLAPAMNAVLLAEEGAFHQALLALALPVSVLALSLGCHRHKQWPMLALGGAGLGILAFTAFFGHDLFGLLGERLATSIGGLTLALAHMQNYLACRRASCQHQ